MNEKSFETQAGLRSQTTHKILGRAQAYAQALRTTPLVRALKYLPTHGTWSLTELVTPNYTDYYLEGPGGVLHEVEEYANVEDVYVFQVVRRRNSLMPNDLTVQQSFNTPLEPTVVLMQQLCMGMESLVVHEEGVEYIGEDLHAVIGVYANYYDVRTDSLTQRPIARYLQSLQYYGQEQALMRIGFLLGQHFNTQVTQFLPEAPKEAQVLMHSGPRVKGFRRNF